MTDTSTAFRFRWLYSDAFDYDQWTAWHSTALPCPGCCHGGPVDGEHQSPAEGSDEYGGYTSEHTYFDPLDPDDHVEWQSETLS